MSTPPKLPLTSHNLTEDKLRILQEHFPEVFTEGNHIDWDRLRLTLGSNLESEEVKERFGLTWPGKRQCFKAIQSPTTATLLPDREASVDFDTTENLYIEGDNLEVLKLLQNSYLGKVKMIYIDPPYNTGNDFVYPDDYTESLKTYLEYTGQVDASGRKFTNNSDTTGRFHSKWLNMMYPRLFLARNLLREDGVIFISIDDGEVAHLRKVCDEIFGEENFVEQIIWKKRGGPPNDKILGSVHEYIICYSKDSLALKLNLRNRTEDQLSRYKNPDNHPKGDWAADNLMANVKGGRFVSSLYFPILNPNTNEEHYPSSNGNWRFNKTKIEQLLLNNEIYFGEDGKGRPKLKRFLSEVKDGVSYPTIWDFVSLGNAGSSEIESIFGNLNVFETPKPSSLVSELSKLGSSPDDIILDFFSGSATTAHAVLALNADDGGNRKFICVQLPEPTRKQKADGTWEESEASRAGFSTISEIGMARIRKVIEKLKAEAATEKNSKSSAKSVKGKAYQSKKDEAPSLGFEETADQLTHNGGGYRKVA
ncbi:site-specific DNA-methyltransferase [Leptospira levettii]|uniref:site-specific DNA-methyltransferase n=1 Tax=Leptospira levettii TaxID=2023178 RepID=UPI00223E180C|nr:site-specific DNA-methyltransferase [Leptospira levettii]MCW7474569.1 site-specific DNA-methyltransferase [Leptospira levettii]